ncbi:MAG: putative Ig domain-containing protein [Synergistaceae bacterium]|nr:putative Ig domain-containing protein [Synergistaceae bacterium]
MANTVLAPVSRVRWTAIGLPAGCTLNESSGVIGGTPTTIGDYTVNLSVENNWSTTTGSLVIHVKEPPTKYAVRRNGAEIIRLTLADLKKRIADRTLEETFRIGDQLILPWTDPYSDTEYECPMNFGTFRNFTLEDGSAAYGLGLQSEYALPPSSYVAFDSRESNNANSDCRSYGNSRWSVSNIRCWLNAKGTPWYSAQHEADAEPISSYKYYKGFMDTFPAGFIDILTPVKNTTKATSYDGGGLDVTLDTFFLLSTHEVFSNPSNDALSDDTEGAYWEIWKKKSGLNDYQVGEWTTNALGAYNIKKIEAHSNDASVWLRNVWGDTTWKVWTISDTGYFQGKYPSSECRVIPACAVC